MSNRTAREELIQQITLSLGGDEIDVELNYDQYNFAVQKAFDRYRQRSSNAVEECFVFLELQPEQQTYVLPDEIIEVRTVYRRGAGVSAGGTGSQIDPFSLAITNSYVIKPGGGGGGLALYELYMEYTALIGQMFGLFIIYTWDSGTKKFTVTRRILNTESILMWVYKYKQDELLLRDTYAKMWIRDWAIAEAKEILGQMRSKFGTYVGPQGGTSMNGAELKQEAIAEKQRLEEEIKNGVDASIGYSIIKSM